MPYKTLFHHSQFHCSILLEVGQITPDTFPNVTKNHDPSAFKVQKSNRMKYYTKTNMVSYDLGHTV